MKVLFNCCPKPYSTTLFKGEKTEVKSPVTKPADSKADTVEISKPKAVEAKAEVKEVKPEAVKTEVSKEAKPGDVKKEEAVAKCEGDSCKK